MGHEMWPESQCQLPQRIVFINNDEVCLSRCKLNKIAPEQVRDSRYFGVTVQENLRFDKCIEAKTQQLKTTQRDQARILLSTEDNKVTGI